MARIKKSFDSYYLFYDSWRESTVDALINLLHEGVHVGSILFHKSGRSMAENRYINGKIYLSYRIKHFKNIYNMLLHDQPLWISFNTDTLRGFIGTDDAEPIGELEPQTQN